MLGALVFAAVAVASTQSNTASYISTVKYKGKATKKKQKNVVYNGVLHLSTTDKKQPNTSSPTELFIARQLKTNGAKLKSCKQSDFDTLPSIPAKCNKAIVGDGTAGAL